MNEPVCKAKDTRSGAGATVARLRSLACVLAALVMLAACAAPQQTFLHRRHRENFALQADELRSVQFYISTEVLARDESAGDTPEGVLVLPIGTPGAVTEVGPSWLRVSFSPRGDGVYFATTSDSTQPDSAYALATRMNPDAPPIRVQELKDHRILTGERELRIVYGDTARLMIDAGQLQKLIDSRTHLPGRAPDSP